MTVREMARRWFLCACAAGCREMALARAGLGGLFKATLNVSASDLPFQVLRGMYPFDISSRNLLGYAHCAQPRRAEREYLSDHLGVAHTGNAQASSTLLGVSYSGYS